MPLDYVIDRNLRLVTATPRGSLTLEEMLGYQREVWSQPDLCGYDEMIVMDEVTDVDSATMGQLKRLASVASTMDLMTGPARMAIVAAQDLHYGLGRMYAVIREDTPLSRKTISVFRTRGDALRWLGKGDGRGMGQ